MGVDALKAELAQLRSRVSDEFTEPRIAQIAKEIQLLASNREVEVLKARKNEEIFLAGVQPLRAEMSRLSSLNIDMTKLKLVSVDQQALEPLAPASPNRPLVLLLGLLLGGVLAICIALARQAIQGGKIIAHNGKVDSISIASSDPRAEGDLSGRRSRSGNSLLAK